MHLRDSLIPRYAEMVYNGYWFAPEREALQALVDDAQKNVTGVARLKLFKGGVWIAGRKSPNSLYDPKIASFEEAGGYEQADAEGFIRLGALRLRALARAGRVSEPRAEALEEHRRLGQGDSIQAAAHRRRSWCRVRGPANARSAITRWTFTSRIPTA